MEGTPPSASDAGIELLVKDKDWAMAEFGPCLIVIWRGTVTQVAMDQVNEQILNITQRRPGNCAYINVIERESPTPPAPLRKSAMVGIARGGKALSCLGVVIEGHELRSTVVRAILTGMALIRAQTQPTKFFKNTQEMSTWVKKQIPTALDNVGDADIVRAIEVVRAQMPH